MNGISRDTGLLQTLFQYDEQGRLTEQRLKLARPAPFAFTAQRRYHYDELGNLSKLEDSHKGTREFFYDPLDRLTQVRGVVEEFFSHDAAGNLLSQLAKKTQAAETTGNRLQFQGDRHFEYDGFGNLIAEKRGKGQQLVTRYQYDCQHRLIKLEKYDGTIAEYKYDAFGRRIEKQVSHSQAEPDDLNSNVVPLIQTTSSKTVTEKTTFLWQANRLIAETNHQDCYRSFVYEPGTYKPLAQLEGKGKKAEVYYYHLDHLGTPQELTNTNGKLVWAVQYRAYGNVVRTIANEIEAPLRFQGQYFDAESGLHYNRHRYYQPETGRFLTPDPIRLAGGLNNYQYVPNPVNWVDPLGLKNAKENGWNNQQSKLNSTNSVQTDEPSIPSVSNQTRETVLSNIDASKKARYSSNMGNGLSYESIPISNKNATKLLEQRAKNRGLSDDNAQNEAKSVVNSFKGQITTRRGKQGEIFESYSDANSKYPASLVFVTQGLKNSTTSLERQILLALPNSKYSRNTAIRYKPAVLKEEQILLQGEVSGQQGGIFGDTYRAGGAQQTVTNGGRYSGKVEFGDEQ